MSIEQKNPLLTEIAGEPLDPVQKKYLDGFFAGVAARGAGFASVEPPPARPQIFEERVKSEEHPLDSYYRIAERAVTSSAPDKEDTFRFKWNGLFYLDPVHQAYMCRLRIPGGQVQSYQLRELGRVAKELTTGYIQVTTRANFQIRLIKPKDAPEVLRRLQATGLTSKGSGADNIRNLTVTPTSGLDPHELIDVLPYCHELAQFIREHREFYDLPRKFNIAFDSGGGISVAENTNDIGIRAVRVGENGSGAGADVHFRITVGGATGHQAFADDLGVLVHPDQIVRVVIALVRVYIANGNRGNRKRARLKHLLEQWPLEKYLGEAEKLLGFQLPRMAPDEAAPPCRNVSHSHIGVFPQKRDGLHYLGIALPIGQLTPDQLLCIADLAEHFGSGEVRLTIWQNILIPNVPEAKLPALKQAIRKAGLDYEASFISGGIVACTGNRYCKYASTDTKGHAAVLVKHLKKRMKLDQPINIHLTGCPHSCAQHYMGDIGLLGTKANVHGEQQEAYHVFVGGGFDADKALGRLVFSGIPFQDLTTLIEKMLHGYLRHREANESFASFTRRHEVRRLQEIFSNDE